MFHSPFGKYCFTCLPFVLSVSQDLFQQHMDRILVQCEVVVGISNDLVIFGDTKEQHDERVPKFFRIARQEGLKLNSSKCTIEADRISFFGRLYTNQGVLSDPKKVEDFTNMPMPQEKPDLQRFLDMATFLSSHLPSFSSQTAILPDLLKENTPFEWAEDHQSSFAQVKSSNHCEHQPPLLQPQGRSGCIYDRDGSCTHAEGWACRIRQQATNPS